MLVIIPVTLILRFILNFTLKTCKGLQECKNKNTQTLYTSEHQRVGWLLLLLCYRAYAYTVQKYLYVIIMTIDRYTTELTIIMIIVVMRACYNSHGTQHIASRYSLSWIFRIIRLPIHKCGLNDVWCVGTRSIEKKNTRRLKKKRTKSKQNFSSDFACARSGMSQLPPPRFENKTLHSRNPHGVVVITAKRWRELSYVCVNLGEWYQIPPFNNNNTIINTIAWLAHCSGDELKTPIKRVRCRYLLKYPPTHLPNMNVCYRGTKVRRHIKRRK